MAGDGRCRMSELPLSKWLPHIIDAAREAGDAIMAVYRTDFDVDAKGDASPVTEADRRGERIILQHLRQGAPEVPVIAEEEVAAGRVPDVDGGAFWLVDPLDGTREFVKRNGDFTVNIALVENGRPALGIVYVPAQDRLFAGCGRGTAILSEGGDPPRPIAARTPPLDGLTVLDSRSHRNADQLDRFLADLPVRERIHAGSSLKFCLVATGEADIYPRFGPTSEWDTAAGQAVVEAAGGSVRRLDGTPLTYRGRPDFLNPFFVVRGLGS